jgi:uncharacterized membrane protein YgdD (TMEM256/DUF423 family)
MQKYWIVLGASLGALAVMLGAFGAHALEKRLDARAMTLFQTANRYHFLHAVALCIVGLMAESTGHPALRISGWAFSLGVLIFSGTVYALALGAPRILGAVTPLGGLLLIAGWLALALAALRR